MTALIAFAAIALAGCAADAQSDAERDPVTTEIGGTATSILNAGVMAEIGEDENVSVKFLFDPLYDDHFGSLEQLTPELIQAIISGAPPYDSVDAVFVSHAHGDHFSASMLTRMLAEQPDLVLIAPAQAVERMREDSNWDAGFAARTRSIALENGEAHEAFDLAGATIEAFRSPHNGWPERHSNVHNITFRVSAPAGDRIVGRVMHLGDADPSAEHYAALEQFLQARRSGLAMVPFWFYREDNLEALIGETLNASEAVAMHVPARVPQDLRDGERAYFSGVGEVLEFTATSE